jgi:putative DNA-invertase from lambdoid prophage Rac
MLDRYCRCWKGLGGCPLARPRFSARWLDVTAANASGVPAQAPRSSPRSGSHDLTVRHRGHSSSGSLMSRRHRGCALRVRWPLLRGLARGDGEELQCVESVVRRRVAFCRQRACHGQVSARNDGKGPTSVECSRVADSRPLRCAVYLRVSTRDQRYLQQFREIRAATRTRGWQIVRVYREKRSSAAGVERPAWNALRRDAQLRRFGAVAVWSLDRIGRSALDILQAVEAFETRGVRLYIAKDALETSGTAGRLIITVLAGVAQLERDLISERTRLGLEAARRRGSQIGRPQARIALQDLYAVRGKERTVADVARAYRVSAMTVRRHLATLAE